MFKNLELKIFKYLKKISQLTQIDIQNNWHYLYFDLSLEKQKKILIDLNTWQPALVNEKGYIIWKKGRQVRWLAQKITVPYALEKYPLSGLTLRLLLTWWAEDAQVFVNGDLVQQGDLFDSSARILLTNCAVPGEEFLVTIRLVSPGHDIGALMRSQCVYERNKNQIDPGFVANELTILSKYISNFEPDKLEKLATEIEQINWDLVANAGEFDWTLNNLRQRLLPLAKNIKKRCFYPLGHAHLDMAWLWTTKETYEVAQRTFQSVLNLQQDFPHLTFGHTSPVLYEWIEQNCPELFTAIQQAVKEEKWEILGGMWVEPDVNLVSGESIIRQLLYGQNYFQEKFGAITRVAWLPDSFGFCWQLPQILKQSGIDYFVTGKLHWNDSNKFPLGYFWWESPDGTQILTLMSPPNITGVMDTNPITMTNYAVDWENQTGLEDIFWLPGVGDHGGGPTKDMLEVANKWENSPFFPQIKFTTATKYLEKISQATKTKSNFSFPIWKDELYLELHRGCYTVHGEQKRFNRYCEKLLYQAELFATIADLINNKNLDSGKQKTIEIAWKKVLFNQFHDILPGTSIPEVFIEANQAWEEAIKLGETILKESLEAIASFINLPSPPHPEAKPIVIFNPLNWNRSEVVTLSLSDEYWEVWDYQGNKLSSQITEEKKLLFLAKDIPSIGYSLFWLSPKKVSGYKNEFTHNFILENKYLKAIVNEETGDLDSIFDKIKQKEILNGKGNQLQAFSDRGQYWDAWNIDPNYEKYPLPPTQLKSIQWLDYGELQQRIRVVRQLGKSEFQQDYLLQTNSPILKIVTTVNWQETHVLVKAAFPLNLESDFATYEIPCGVIKRSTCPQTPEDKAKWEVPALHWADLTDNKQEYGVSLLNDCKYGYDSQPNQLRLTLLRSPLWPDPTADRGIHHFSYGIYPHQGSWQFARTVHKGYEFNLPLQVVFLDRIVSKKDLAINQLPPLSRLIYLSSENLILMALKPGKNQDLILRCYECHGENAEISLQGDLSLSLVNSTNLLEQEVNKNSQHIFFNLIKPWKISSFQLTQLPVSK
jgi:alpha-mannosidase